MLKLSIVIFLASVALAKDKECTPGESVPAGDGCNVCTCDTNGRIGMCTIMACPPKIELAVCTPGKKTVPAADGCNTCLCNADGSIGGCTLMKCPPKDILNHYPVNIETTTSPVNDETPSAK